MKDKKTDARVVKTKQRIETTFLKLLETMPFEKLTTTLASLSKNVSSAREPFTLII